MVSFVFFFLIFSNRFTHIVFRKKLHRLQGSRRRVNVKQEMSSVLGAKKISFWSVLGASRERIYERAAGPGQESACSLPTHLALGLKAGLPPCRPLRGVQRLGHGPGPGQEHGSQRQTPGTHPARRAREPRPGALPVPTPVVARPQSGLGVVQPARRAFPVPLSQAQPLQPRRRGSAGSPQGRASSLHSPPPPGLFPRL